MTICGTCKKCGGDSYDYVCIDCTLKENIRLRAAIERVVNGEADDAWLAAWYEVFCK